MDEVDERRHAGEGQADGDGDREVRHEGRAAVAFVLHRSRPRAPSAPPLYSQAVRNPAPMRLSIETISRASAMAPAVMSEGTNQ